MAALSLIMQALAVAAVGWACRSPTCESRSCRQLDTILAHQGLYMFDPCVGKNIVRSNHAIYDTAYSRKNLARIFSSRSTEPTYSIQEYRAWFRFAHKVGATDDGEMKGDVIEIRVDQRRNGIGGQILVRAIACDRWSKNADLTIAIGRDLPGVVMSDIE
jgi:hypothetical protein